MEKRLLFTKEAAATYGGMYAEPPVSLIRPGHTKIAEVDTPLHETIQAFVQALKPSDDETWVLINALGAGEQYGDNINGDFFPYKELVTHTDEFLSIHPQDVEKKRAVAKKIGYGYPTFYNAHIFKHHVNKDPSKSFGTIEAAVWNERMKRVEIIARLIHALCEKFDAMDIVNRINNGEHPDTSMGCRVPFDVCSICQNQAKVKEDYCIHIQERRKNKDPRGDGQRPYMINIRPLFFDDSFVFIGADKTARTLMKLAGVPHLFSHILNDLEGHFAGASHDILMKAAEFLLSDGYRPYEGSAQQLAKVAQRFGPLPQAQPLLLSSQIPLVGNTKTASVKESQLRQVLRKVAALQKLNKHMKLSDIIKYVVPNPHAKEVSETLGQEPDLPEEMQDTLGEKGLETAIQSTANKGIILKPNEFLRIVLVSSGMKDIADSLRGCSLAPSDEVTMPCGVDAGEGDEDLCKKLEAFTPERSIIPPRLITRIVKITMSPRKEIDKEPELAKNELLDKVSAAYNGYRLWLISNADELGLTKRAVSLASSFSKTAAAESSIDLEMASAYLQGAYWRAGERNT